jgi:hypothetical protein
MENSYIGSFNVKLRDELLKQGAIRYSDRGENIDLGVEKEL